MVALVTTSFVETRLAETFTAVESAQVGAFIDDASAIVLDVGNSDWDPDDGDNLPPDVVKGVVFQMVRRAYTNPDGHVSEKIGDYSYTREQSRAAGGMTMTKAEYETVRRAAGRSNVTTVGVRRPDAYERQFISDLLTEDELVL